MNRRNLLWILAPIALSAGVIWLSAQETKGSPEGLKLGELAEKLQAREKSVAQKEADLGQLEQRLGTLQAALAQERTQLEAREKTLKEQIAKFDQERNRPTIDEQLPRTYEAMDPMAGARAVQELAKLNPEVTVSLLASMSAKKAAKLMDQLATLDPKLTGQLSERIGLTRKAKA